MKHTKEKFFLQQTYGISVQELTQFGAGVVNQNFHVTSNDGEFVWKINSHKNFTQMQDELAMLQACSHLPVPHVRADVHGSFIHSYDEQYGWLYDFIEGEICSDSTPAIVRAMGEVLARIHLACEGVASSDQQGRWDHVRLRDVMDDFLKEHSADAFGGVDLAWVRAQLDMFDFPTLPEGMTHQDMKPENLLVCDERIVGVLDFDNAYYGVLLHDVHTIAIWTCFGAGELREDLLTELYAGYESVRPFTSDEYGELRRSLLFRLLREVFIGPYAAQRVSDEVRERGAYFLDLYKKLI